MPILCIDLGSKKTGVAISYDPFVVAESLPTIFHSSEKELLNILLGIIDSKKVSKIENAANDEIYKREMAVLKQYIQKPEVKKTLGKDIIRDLVSSIIG